MISRNRISRRQILIWGGLACGAAGSAALTIKPQGNVHASQRSGIAFGTVVSLKARHHDNRGLEAALDAAWSEIVKVQETANLFDPMSALSRLNRDGHLDDAPETLMDMLTAAQEVSELTHGAFDITVQPLWTLYEAAYGSGRPPSPDEIAALRSLIGYRNIKIDGRSIRLACDMKLTLNGIAQGYATERCLRALANQGITNAFLNTGEIGIAGTRDESHAWTAAIADPRSEGKAIALAGPLSGVLATSGDYATTFTPDFSAHHIFDPKTLRSPTRLASVSVLAPSGAYADALATAMMVLEPEDSLALAARMGGIELLLIGKQGEIWRTPAFRSRNRALFQQRGAALCQLGARSRKL